MPAHRQQLDVIVMRATIAIATKAKMPVHQWQHCHHNKGDDASLTMSIEHTRLFGATLESVQWPLSQPSQQGKESLDKANCTDSSVMPNNHVCHWTGWVEVGSP
jgi:hypothetical protein